MITVTIGTLDNDTVMIKNDADISDSTDNGNNAAFTIVEMIHKIYTRNSI